jgi:hypothetical protein
MREQVQTVLEESNDVTILNPLSINWSSYKWEEGYFPHKLNIHEILKPYMISFNYYGTVEYEDALLALNGIADIFELKPGAEIRIPKINELKFFIFQNKK